MGVHDDGSPGLALLGTQFQELAGLLAQSRSGPPDPERVVRLATEAMPDGAQCGLTLIRGGRRPVTVAASDDVAREVDAIQSRTGDGPALTQDGASDVIRSDDLATEQRWPGFSPRCVAETGVRSIACFRLVLYRGLRGAMTFSARESAAFSELAVGTGAIFAPFAAMALQSALHAQEAADLQVALTASRQIGTAVGILMTRDEITSEQAFAQLVHASQHLNRKLRDVAAEVTMTGTLPVVPARRTTTR